MRARVLYLLALLSALLLVLIYPRFELTLLAPIALAAIVVEHAPSLVGLDILDGPGRSDLPPAKVTSECFSPTFGKSLALGFVSTPTLDIGRVVQLGEGRVARVAALPFYDPKRCRPRDNPL